MLFQSSLNRNVDVDVCSAPKIMGLTCDWMEKSELLPVHMEMLHDRVLPELNRELFAFLQACYFRFKLGSLNFLAKTNDEQEEIHQRVLMSFEKRDEYFMVEEECPPLKETILSNVDLSKDQNVYEFIVEEWFPTKCSLLKKALLYSVAWHYKLKKNVEQSELSLLSVPFLPKKFATTILTFCYVMTFNKIQTKPKDIIQTFERNFNYGVVDLLNETEIHIVKLMYLFESNSPTSYFKKMAEQKMFQMDESIAALINDMKSTMIENNLKLEKEIKNLVEKNKKFERDAKNKEQQHNNQQEKMNKIEKVVTGLKAENKSKDEKIKKLENNNKNLENNIKNLENNIKKGNESKDEKIKKLDERNKKLEDHVQNLESILSELKTENKSKDENVKKLENDIKNLENNINELKKEIESKDEQIKNLEGDITYLKNQNAVDITSLSNLRKETDDLKWFHSHLNARYCSLIHEFSERNRVIQTQDKLCRCDCCECKKCINK